MLTSNARRSTEAEPLSPALIGPNVSLRSLLRTGRSATNLLGWGPARPRNVAPALRSMGAWDSGSEDTQRFPSKGVNVTVHRAHPRDARRNQERGQTVGRFFAGNSRLRRTSVSGPLRLEARSAPFGGSRARSWELDLSFRVSAPGNDVLR
jgi:hypothetical protein